MGDSAARGVVVKVFGDYACFSRPEFKVERVSYSVITPSAARGVLEAIFWRPEFRYEIRAINVLRLGTQAAILRNEIGTRQWRTPVVVEKERQQRTSLMLKNVSYTIRAELMLKPHVAHEPGKYLDQFRRRVEKGQYHHTPYLGTRECAASFEPANGELVDPQLKGRQLDLGQMLFDIAYIGGERGSTSDVKALFFRANLHDGVLVVPRERYRELRDLENGRA